MPSSATQYNPPWAHNYGFNYPGGPPFGDPLDTRSHAAIATIRQASIGYNSFNLPNSGANIAFNNMKDDAIFFTIGHGASVHGENGGALWFYNGTSSFIVAEFKGEYIRDAQGNPADQYFLSSLSTELKDVLLAVYVNCWSGKTHSLFGNLVDMSAQKGVDNVIGFSGAISYPHSGYWSDRFWYRCQVGPLGQHQTIRNNANAAMMDVLSYYGAFGGTNTLYARYRIPYNYLDPARYGVV